MRLDGLPAWWDVDVKDLLYLPPVRVLVLQFFPWVLNLHQKPAALSCQRVLMGNAFIFLEPVRGKCAQAERCGLDFHPDEATPM